MIKTKHTPTIPIFVSLILFTGLGLLAVKLANSPKSVFDGRRAMGDVERQVSFGPRTPGSNAHAQTIDYIRGTLD